MKIPHLVQYQGSKRNLASKIIQFFPKKFNRLIEPFAGSAAISIACAFNKYTENFLINDSNPALSNLLRLVVQQPNYVAEKYEAIWKQQLENPMEFYNKNRIEFNHTQDPVIFLYLLARCVKGSVRYNSSGEFNQSPDKRRLGTAPEKMRKNIIFISSLLNNKCEFVDKDYREILKFAKQGDLVYMDPPYQGVCGNKDSRYYSGIDFNNFIDELENLNNRGIHYVISYDGKCGNKKYGEDLPKYLGLKRILIEAGRSSQATLLGRDQKTVESLYMTEKLFKNSKPIKNFSKPTQLNLIRTVYEERIF